MYFYFVLVTLFALELRNFYFFKGGSTINIVGCVTTLNVSIVAGETFK